MVRIVLLLTAILFSFHSTRAQTEEQQEEVWMQKGLAAAEQGNYREAIPYIEKVCEIIGKKYGENNEAYGLTCHTLSTFYEHLGEYDKAVEVELKALASYKEVFGENHPQYASILSNVAGYYADLGDYAKALEMGTSATEICRAALGENCLQYATLIANLAGYYYELGDYTKALELGTRAMEIRRDIIGEDNNLYAMSLNNIATYYSELGDYAKAVEVGTKALEIYKAVYGDQNPNYATVLSNLAGFHDRLGNYDKAVEMGTQVVAIFKATLGDNHPSLGSALNNAAIYCSHLGDYETAAKAATMALKIRKVTLGENHPAYATTLANLAGIYFELGDYAEALEMETKAMEIRKTVLGEHHPNYALTLAYLAYFHAEMGHHAQALEFIRENTTLVMSNTLWQFATMTTAQRTLFWEQYSEQFTDVYPLRTYLSGATTAGDLYDKSALFAKGLLLTTEIEMNRLIQESGDAEAHKMFEELTSQRQQLQKLYETPINERWVDTDSLEQAVYRLEQALVKRSKVYGDFTKKLRTTWKDVQKGLKKDEIAIEFLSFPVEGTDSTMVTALTLRKDDKEPKFTPLFEQKQLREVSDRTYYHCQELTALVWQPLQQELKGVKTIYFSPAGALHNIGIEYAPGMEEYDMFRLSTTREVIDMKERGGSPSTAHSSVALFGGIDYNASLTGGAPLAGNTNPSGEQVSNRALIDSIGVRGLTASYLPFTLTEVQAIKSSFDGKKRTSTITTGTEATEASVKALSTHAPHILHIATHGFYFTENQARSKKKLHFLGQDAPQGTANLEDRALTRSGLLLAGANATMKGKDVPQGVEDGILTAQEISHLDLRGLDLVVLSACKTGTGDINQGEGVFGLQRGFKKAGAQTLVMSLWEVNDEATQILMIAFYNNLMQGLPKHEAFHQAQRTLREQVDDQGNRLFDEPQYWAAFILLD